MTAEPLAALPMPVDVFDGYQPIRIETTTGQVREVRGREVAVRADALVARLDTGHVVDWPLELLTVVSVGRRPAA